jgi:DNA-binding LacI/PurR family transcriptional regulator
MGSIGVVLPDAINNMPHNTALMVNSLRGQLTKEGFQLTLHESRQFYQRNGIHMLKKLSANNRHDCWLLFFATPSVQQWFQQSKLPCLVIGSNHADITLPTISPDHFGMGCHAAGVLLSNGHRRIAHLHRGRKTAGDLLAEAGVKAALSASSGEKASVVLLEFDDHVEAFVLKLLRLLKRPNPPTGLLVSSSHYVIAVLTALLSEGYRVPRDISIICLADSPTIKHYTVPLLAHYSVLSRNHHLRVLRLIHQLLNEGSVRKQHTLIFPEFHLGASIAPPNDAPQ